MKLTANSEWKRGCLGLIKKLIKDYPDYIKSLKNTTPLKYFQNNLTFINKNDNEQDWLKHIDIFFKGEKYNNKIIEQKNKDKTTILKIFQDEHFQNIYIYNKNRTTNPGLPTQAALDILNLAKADGNNDEERQANAINTATTVKYYALNPGIKMSKFNIKDGKVVKMSLKPPKKRGQEGSSWTGPLNMKEFVSRSTSYLNDDKIFCPDCQMYDIRDSNINQKKPLNFDVTDTFYYHFFKDPIKYLTEKIENAEKMFNTPVNYLNMVKLLFLIGFKKEEKEVVTRMLVYALDVRFGKPGGTPRTENVNDTTIVERKNVLQKEILNTLFFHTIANDAEGYGEYWKKLKNTRNELLDSLLTTDPETWPHPPSGKPVLPKSLKTTNDKKKLMSNNRSSLPTLQDPVLNARARQREKDSIPEARPRRPSEEREEVSISPKTMKIVVIN